jgi:acyl dehydratase
MSELAVTTVRHGPFPAQLAPDAIARYAAATGDQTPAVVGGSAVPATFPVIAIFAAQDASGSDLPDWVWQQARGGVHGEHDIVLHRPLLTGERLDTWSQISAIRTSRAGTQVVFHMEQFDAEGALAVEHWWTLVLLGLTGLADAGSMPADHRIPASARATRVGSATHYLDDGLAHRYAEVSGDFSAHHFDIDVAKAAGFGYLFAHGLCTMAICTHRLVELLDIGDPGRIARVAVRFAAPTPMGTDLTVTAYEIDGHA